MDSNSNKELAAILTHDLRTFETDQLENIKIMGWEESYLNNNFPTYMGKHQCRILLSENFAAVFPIQRVFFLPFPRHMNPFVLTSDVEELQRLVRTSRVYKPKNFKISNFEKNLEVEFNFKAVLNLRIHIVFENLKRTEFEKLQGIIIWC